MRLTIKQFQKAKKDKAKKFLLSVILNENITVHKNEFFIKKDVVDVTNFDDGGFKKYMHTGTMTVAFIASEKKKEGKK